MVNEKITFSFDILASSFQGERDDGGRRRSATFSSFLFT
jgi:hypothetical protein